jgi:hypothetical protein
MGNKQVIIANMEGNNMTKKLLTAITSLLVFSAVAVSAMFCTPAFAALVGDDGVDAFSPKKFTASKASGTISVDGSETAESAYGSNTINVEASYGGAGLGATGTKAVAHVAWDDTYIYIHMNVTDSTNCADPDGSFDSDSIEFYLDFDNNKTKYNRLGGNANGIYAGQYRVQRGSTNSKITDIAVTPTEEMRKLAEQSKVAVKEKSGGYIVEVAMPHKNYALSKDIGFALQINDADEPGKPRKGVMYSSHPVQYFAYRYTFLLDTLTLEGFTPTTSRTKAADDVDDAGSSGSASTASSGSTSSRPSSTSSKPSSSAATSSAAATASVTSSNTSATANTSSVSSDVTASAESTEAAADLNDSEAAENEQQTGTSAEKNKGGLSTGAIIGIVAGAVVILAAAAAVVLILLKKKSASVEADGQDDEPDNADENSDSGQDEQ